MSNLGVIGYNSLSNERNNPFIRQEASTDTENEDTPQDTGVMIHVVPETSKSKPVLWLEDYFKF